MNITIENKKAKAIELMKKLDIYKPYIKGFEKDNTVCFYENFGGFWAWQEPELMEKIKTFEEKHNCLVYAVTHEYTEFGECYDFLYISDYEEEWDEMLYSQGNMYYTFAYVWNADDDFCSEFGTIGIRSFGGEIKRDYLKSVCKNNNWRLVNVGKNHYCFSAFIKSAENKCVYISISDVRYFSNEWYDHILIRTAENETDYRGGFNNYTTLSDLEGTAADLLNDLPF